VGYRWIEQFAGGRRQELYDLYSKELWTQGRLFDDVMHMIEHSDIVLRCCADDGKLIGFSRVLTDYTFKAMIFDVIVDETYRSRGVRKAIVNLILGHEALKSVRSFELYCPDGLVPFYETLGFVKHSSALLRHQRSCSPNPLWSVD